MTTKIPSAITAYLLLFALCIDGFFEGLAIGAQSAWHQTVFVTTAVVINKWNVALTLGISLKKDNTDMKSFIRLILLFSMFTPFGVMLGYFIGNMSHLIKGICLGLAAGAFVYVSGSVVIIEEFTVTKYKYSKFFCYLIGGMATAGITVAGIL